MLVLFFQVSEDNKKVRRVTTKPLPEETAEARHDAKTKTVYCVSCVKHAVQLYSVIGVTLKPYNSTTASQFQKASQICQSVLSFTRKSSVHPYRLQIYFYTVSRLHSFLCNTKHFFCPSDGALELHITHISKSRGSFSQFLLFSLYFKCCANHRQCIQMQFTQHLSCNLHQDFKEAYNE